MRDRNKMKRRLSSEVDATIVDVNDFKESQDTVDCDTYDVIFINGFLSCNETTSQCCGFHPCNEWYDSITNND